LALVALLLGCPALAQDASLLSYEGADRTDRLVAAAKAEGTLTLYTAFRPQDLQTVLAPFETKYGIKIAPWRSGSGNVLQRVLQEAAGKRNEVDAILIPATEMEALRREKLLQPVKSPHFKELMVDAVPAHREWAPVLLNILVQTYNTNLIKKEELPKTFEDLLNPRWKGKLGIEAKLDEWYWSVVMSMGEEKGVKFFNDLSARNGISARQGMSLLHNLVVAGDVPLALAVYRDLPEKSRRRGAAVDWFALDPVVAQPFVVSVARRAKHPNAALLFHDYLLSAETQTLLSSLDFYSVNANVQPPSTHLRIRLIDPVSALDNAEKATKAFEDMLAKQGK
jgi:iron(III) transport system substrate-binding protein